MLDKEWAETALKYIDSIFDRDGLQAIRGQAWNDSDRMLLQEAIRVLTTEENKP